VPVSVVNKPPAFSTEDARKLGITDLVAEFETPYDPGYPRVTKINRAVEILDGTILKPNETFDLNQRLGERTVDRGFVLAPMIDEGRLKDDVGGGVSQIATMLYNGAFLSGLKLIHHTPHSFYITRYPMGREATVSWGGPELTFQNDWAAPLVINLQAFDDHIVVRFFSRKLGRRIEYGTDEPTDIVEAKTRKVLNSQLAVGETKTVQEGGQQGFAVTYWRKVFAGSKLSSNETFSWTYHPEDTIIEVGPTPPPPPPASSSEETPTSSEEPPTTEPPPTTATEPPPTSGATSS
jgi:vancomycin resistance protein YoaR